MLVEHLLCAQHCGRNRRVRWTQYLTLGCLWVWTFMELSDFMLSGTRCGRWDELKIWCQAVPAGTNVSKFPRRWPEVAKLERRSHDMKTEELVRSLKKQNEAPKQELGHSRWGQSWQPSGRRVDYVKGKVAGMVVLGRILGTQVPTAISHTHFCWVRGKERA